MLVHDNGALLSAELGVSRGPAQRLLGLPRRKVWPHAHTQPSLPPLQVASQFHRSKVVRAIRLQILGLGSPPSEPQVRNRACGVCGGVGWDVALPSAASRADCNNMHAAERCHIPEGAAWVPWCCTLHMRVTPPTPPPPGAHTPPLRQGLTCNCVEDYACNIFWSAPRDPGAPPLHKYVLERHTSDGQWQILVEPEDVAMFADAVQPLPGVLEVQYR